MGVILRVASLWRVWDVGSGVVAIGGRSEGGLPLAGNLRVFGIMKNEFAFGGTDFPKGLGLGGAQRV